MNSDIINHSSLKNITSKVNTDFLKLHNKTKTAHTMSSLAKFAIWLETTMLHFSPSVSIDANLKRNTS